MDRLFIYHTREYINTRSDTEPLTIIIRTQHLDLNKLNTEIVNYVIIIKVKDKHCRVARFSLTLSIVISLLLLTIVMFCGICGICNPYSSVSAFKSTQPPGTTPNQLSSNQPDVSSSDTSALVEKGDAFYDQGNRTQAIQYIDKALAIDPNYKLALDNKGAALINLGNHTQAIQYFDKALAIDPNYKIALNAKQYILSKMGH